jgi:hypothetical protein
MWTTSLDLMDAYFHIPIAPPFRKFLRFVWDNKLVSYPQFSWELRKHGSKNLEIEKDPEPSLLLLSRSKTELSPTEESTTEQTWVSFFHQRKNLYPSVREFCCSNTLSS